MPSRLRCSIPLIALSGLACACTAPVSSTTSSPPTSTTEEPINSGGKGQPPQPINSSSDPVSQHFYQYTVALSGGWGECTGVIIAPTLILTAAHCQADGSTVVHRYTDTGIKDNGGDFAVIPNNPTAVQNGVTCAPNAHDIVDPSTCMSNGHFADLAIITLQRPINTPSPANPLAYYNVILGPEGQYSNFFDFSNWAVGAGSINGVSNVAQNLMWIPAIISTSDTASCRLVGACKTPGYFTGTLNYGGDGDSGGPLYQEAQTLNGDFVLVGIMHSATTSRLIDENGKTAVSVWTSVEYPANYEWIKSQIAAAPVVTPNFATFGASK